MPRTRATTNSSENQRERDNREVAYRAALEGIVLLKNDNALPVSLGNIALFGAGAQHTVKGGSGSGEVNERYNVSIFEGLERAGFTITSKAWLDDYRKTFRDGEEHYAKAAAKKFMRFDLAGIANIMANPYRYPYGRAITDEDIQRSATDTCIYVIARQAGEGGDRRLESNDYSLSDMEKNNLKKCAAAYKKFIVVINVGAAFDVSFIEEISSINALMFFCQQGMEGGTAFADIVSGKVSPSGKLTDTWVKKYDDIPFARDYSYLNGDVSDEFYREGIYVGYRYFDSFQIAPQYEFGYGLSYTEFDIKVVSVAVENTFAVIKVQVSNCGKKYSGKEIVQVYVSCPQGRLSKEYQRLAAFAKTRSLAPSEIQEIEMRVDFCALTSYDESTAASILEAGAYIFRVGSSSRNTLPVAIVKLAEEVIVSAHKNICPLTQLVDEIAPPKIIHAEDFSNLPELTIDSSAFATKIFSYADQSFQGDLKVDQLLATLSVKDMIELVVGAGLQSMLFSKNYFSAPGAAGNTTSALIKKGIINITFADGPAGLRLLKTSAATRSGAIKMIDPMIEVMKFMPRLIKKFLFGNLKKDTLLYQFTTAFPVELALAQSWNVELLHEVGYAVSKEMSEYGVTFWLAPGMNIHRNPLCGRNFEYFSEDPFLTGKLAAAMTSGCQSIAGNYATIKHFCANNQEENRFKVSSHLSERALREIYLRGFEIAVTEARPVGVMSAYNKVNGVYASNSHDLCSKVLRNEWGFDGVVMTDWMGTGKGFASNSECMQAGNDLIMPGSGYCKKQLLTALKRGGLRESDLRRCAANVLRAIVNSGLSRQLQAG